MTNFAPSSDTRHSWSLLARVNLTVELSGQIGLPPATDRAIPSGY